MKTTKTLLTVAVFAAVAFGAQLLYAENASAKAGETQPVVQHGRNFVDADGDGFNDNAPDADGDGIPNGQDPDYVRPKNGSGRQNQAANGTGQGIGKGQGKGYGNGNESGKGDLTRQRLRDGSEAGGTYGPGATEGTGKRGGGQNGKGRSNK
ncbi:MAG: hypothetical protein JXB48_17700 [Candidatus Latescibacteria bacterium]|nr:hypothetical protein [Candidatus Latescibacterota bacterium]